MALPLRLFSFGDIHYNLPCMNSVVAFVNQAVDQGKCDIVVNSGDLCSSSHNADLSELTNLKNNYFDKIKVPYFLVPGNHDVIGSTCSSGCSDHVGAPKSCNFRTVYGAPNSLKTFVKDGITYQIIGVSICPDSSADYYWVFDFAQLGLSKTFPTIVLNHGPIVLPSETPCGSWSDNIYLYAINQGLKAKMDVLNVLASYTGHVHSPNKTIINNRLYISNNTISDSNERCTEDSTRFIGYTKIVPTSATTFTVMYGLLRYRNADGTVPSFVDPFPDDGACLPLTCNLIMNSPDIPNTISNISTATGKLYLLDELADAKLFYIDRTYQFTNTPSSYVGLDYIRTATDDRYEIDPAFLQFDLSHPATVYVAYDDRISPKPSWLSSFTDTDDNILRDGSAIFSIYTRDYPAGHVSLGGCSIPAGGVGGMYVVISSGSRGRENSTPSGLR